MRLAPRANILCLFPSPHTFRWVVRKTTPTRNVSEANFIVHQQLHTPSTPHYQVLNSDCESDRNNEDLSFTNPRRIDDHFNVRVNSYIPTKYNHKHHNSILQRLQQRCELYYCKMYNVWDQAQLGDRFDASAHLPDLMSSTSVLATEASTVTPNRLIVPSFFKFFKLISRTGQIQIFLLLQS